MLKQKGVWFTPFSGGEVKMNKLIGYATISAALCPRCGTPMSGGICPECGFPVNQIRKAPLRNSANKTVKKS